jgi:F-type H+-transporting ATPase subunit delta
LNDHTSARRYARAIIETTVDSRAVRDELIAMSSALRATAGLQDALVNPGVPVANKKAIAAAAFSGLTAPLPRLLEMLIDAARVELLHEIARKYVQEWNAQNNVHAAKVVTAMPLDDDGKAAIKSAIETAVSGAVEMETAIDPALVGGVKVEVDGHLFDGSVRARLKALREQLL